MFYEQQMAALHQKDSSFPVCLLYIAMLVCELCCFHMFCCTIPLCTPAHIQHRPWILALCLDLAVYLYLYRSESKLLHTNLISDLTADMNVYTDL